MPNNKINQNSVHLIGIGGIGLSALARYFLTQNWLVSGSDTVNSPLIQELRKEGVRIKIDPKTPSFGPKTSLIVHSQAIPSHDIEIRTAKARKIPVLSYPEAVGFLTEKYRTIAIAGAHGKSTTTAMVAEIFLKAKLDPTVIVGTKLKSLAGKNFRRGNSSWLILEADEFGGAFWHYSPAAAIISNIDKEHLDFYKNFNGVKKSFLRFIKNIQDGGLLILNQDDKNLFSLKNQIGKITKNRKIKTHWFSLAADPLLSEKISGLLKVPGRHNLSNALGSFVLAEALNIKKENIFAGLKNYTGAWRRFEYKGKFKTQNSKLKISVYDDYAHHPTEIKATLTGVKEKFPNSKIICIFQPHQAKRLKLLFQDFTESFNEADVLILLPSYQVAGRDNDNLRYDSEALFKAIQKKNSKKEIYYLQSPVNLKKFLNSHLHKSALNPHKSAILIMMGAGNIADLTKELI
ncbi:MAG: UDP-N-acetylmuramate--L-alanine ligase [bacterium]|nr:UDP-N-acetylmuramate--L-alanine ligase [bacterium]